MNTSYFESSDETITSAFCIKSKFNLDMFQLAKAGYLLDFCDKLSSNSNCVLKCSDLVFKNRDFLLKKFSSFVYYDLFTQGLIVPVMLARKRECFFKNIGLLQNLCVVVDTTTKKYESFFVTKNKKVIDALKKQEAIEYSDLCFVDSQEDLYSTTLDEVQADAIKCFKLTRNFSNKLSVSKHLLLLNKSLIIFPYYALRAFKLALLDLLYSKKVELLYSDAGQIIKLYVTIKSDSLLEENKHFNNIDLHCIKVQDSTTLDFLYLNILNIQKILPT